MNARTDYNVKSFSLFPDSVVAVANDPGFRARLAKGHRGRLLQLSRSVDVLSGRQQHNHVRYRPFEYESEISYNIGSRTL